MISRQTFSDVSLIFLISVITRSIFYFVFGEWGWEHDSYEHFYQSRRLANEWDWNIAFNAWNKSLFTILSSGLINVWDSLWAVRIANTIIWTVTSVYVYLIVLKRTDIRWVSVVAAIFCLFDYVAFRGSVSALSEPLAGLVIVCAIYYHRSVFGFLTLLRPELVILTLPFFFEKPTLKLVKDIAFTAIPSVLALLLSFIALGDAWYPFRSTYPVSTGGTYGVGTFLYYCELLVFYNPVLLLSLLLCWLVRERISSLKLVASLLAFVVFHTILYAFDLMGSAGLPRYFNATIPLFSILLGDYLIIFSKRNLFWVQTMSCVLLLVVGGRTLNLLNDESWYHNAKTTPEKNERILEFADRVRAYIDTRPSKPVFYSADPAIRYFVDLPVDQIDWPSLQSLKNRGQIIAVEENLKRYVGISKDEAFASGEIIFADLPRYLVEVKALDTYKVNNREKSIIWRNRNLVNYSNHSSKIYYEGESIVVHNLEGGGAITFGPYIELPIGEYSVSFKVWCTSDLDSERLRFDVYNGEESIGKDLTVSKIRDQNGIIVLDFDVGRDGDPYEFRVVNEKWAGKGMVRIESIYLLK